MIHCVQLVSSSSSDKATSDFMFRHALTITSLYVVSSPESNAAAELLRKGTQWDLRLLLGNGEASFMTETHKSLYRFFILEHHRHVPSWRFILR